MKQHISFTFTAALASAALNLALVYSLAILFSYPELTLKKVVLLFLLQFLITIIVPRLFVWRWFKDYLKQCRNKAIKPLSPRYFWIQLGLFYLLLLVVLFQLVALLTNNLIAVDFGLVIDQLFPGSSSSGEMDGTFAEQSFFVQNFFLCIFGFIISLAVAGSLYKGLVRRYAMSMQPSH